MAGKAVDGAKNLINTIGAMQTLVENFPMSLMSLFSFRDVKLQFSFDLIVLLFKILGITREEALQ
jgi:hypothetical protein